VSVGDALAQARGQAGLSIAQVSQRTCIRETIIRGIERDDFSACGGDFYARGHIRSIARTVGLEPDELVHEYDVTHGNPHTITAADVFEPSTPIKLRERRTPNWTVAMVLVLAIIIGYGIYRLVAPGSPAHEVASGTPPSGHVHHSSSPQPAPTPSPTPTHISHHVVIRLTADQTCWVEFTKPNGVYLTQATVYAGSTQSWTFRHAVVMTIGNPGGILLTVNGKHLGRPGGSSSPPLTLSFGPGKKLPSPSAGTAASG
jgi:cytoskeletal protein RodZ